MNEGRDVKEKGNRHWKLTTNDETESLPVYNKKCFCHLNYVQTTKQPYSNSIKVLPKASSFHEGIPEGGGGGLYNIHGKTNNVN